MRNGGVGGRWSWPLVVRALGLLIVLLVAAAGLAVAALTSQGGRDLPMEHGMDRPTIGDVDSDADAVVRQGSS